MANLFRAFFFKLKKDLTFRIALIIGIAMAIFMTLAFLIIDIMGWVGSDEPFKATYCAGQNLLINTLNPAQNFGLVVPILLTVFTVAEYNNGIIRNKIIAGNSKTKIYFSILLSSLVFTFCLVTAYIGLCVALSSMIGGFNVNGHIFSTSNVISAISTLIGNTHTNGEFYLKLIITGVLVYIFVTAMTVFFATLFRSMGPCIPIVIVLLIIMSSETMIANVWAMSADEQDHVADIMVMLSRWLNPLFGLDSYGTKQIAEQEAVYVIENEHFMIHAASNFLYITAFTLGGWAIFRKRDVK